MHSGEGYDLANIWWFGLANIRPRFFCPLVTSDPIGLHYTVLRHIVIGVWDREGEKHSGGTNQCT